METFKNPLRMSSQKETLSLIARLATVSFPAERSEWERALQEAFNALLQTVENDFIPLLSQSSYPQKSRLRRNVEQIIQKSSLFLRYPFLYGRTAVGIVTGKSTASTEFLLGLSKGEKQARYARQASLPFVVYNSSEPRIFAANHAQIVVELSPDEYWRSMKLYHNGIQLRDLLGSFAFGQPMLRHPNTNYLVFPYFAPTHTQEYKSLAALCSVFFLLYEPERDYQNLLPVFRASSVPLYVVAPTEDVHATQVVESLRKKLPEREVHLVAPTAVEKLLAQYDHAQHNFILEQQLLVVSLELLSHAMQLEQRCRQVVASLAHDSVFAENMQEQILDLRQQELQTLEDAKRSIQQSETLRTELLQAASAYENALKGTQRLMFPLEGDDEDPQLHTAFESLYGEIIRLALQCQKRDLALHYLYKLQETKFPFAFVYKLYCDENAEHTLDSEALLQLQQSTATTPLMQHARIHFAEEIGLNVQERNQIAAGLTQKNTEELYFAACEKEVVSGKEEAYNKYLKAFNAGSRQAGDWLANYYITKQNNSSHDMKRLADALIPSAAFEYGKDCLQNNRYAQGVTYLRIACTKRFVPAITYYADLLYQEILQNKDKAETIEKKAQNAISLYQFLLDNHINETAPAAKLGVLYYQQQNIERAKYFLEQDTSLPEAKYCMGCMYAEGTYVAQDDDKANTYLKEALKAGYSKADAPLQQIKKRKQKKQASKQTQRQKKTSSQQYKEHADYSSKSTLTSSDEGCFITTATCTAMNKPDDCEELTAFRRFRDDVLLSTPEGKLLVKEYYRIAPSIVDCISREADAADCYQKLYRDYILPGYCALAHGDTHTAVQLYSRMVESLAKKYFIE